MKLINNNGRRTTKEIFFTLTLNFSDDKKVEYLHFTYLSL